MYDINKKIIFTHPPKCGGTSIEDLLGFLKLRQKYPHINRIKHASLEEHFNELKNKNVFFRDFYTFSIIRNPWSRAVSFYNHYKYKEFYYWRNKTSHEELLHLTKDATIMTFKEFIFKYSKSIFNHQAYTNPFMFFQNEFCLDYVVRLEYLKEDLSTIKNKLQIDFEIDIPHRNNADEFLPRKHYTEYYDAETKDLIEKCFEWDIKTFNYKFD